MSPSDEMQVLYDEVVDLIQEARDDLGDDLQGMAVDTMVYNAFPETPKWRLVAVLERLKLEGHLTDDWKVKL